MGTSEEFDRYITKMVGHAMTGIEVDEPIRTRLTFQIEHILRQVERDARAVAYARVNDCANAVNNDRPV